VRTVLRRSSQGCSVPLMTQERITYFERLLAQLPVTARPEEFPSVASGYRAEVETMQQEVLNYLTRHASVPASAG
jgi:predicted phosphoribosyltransferase